MDEGAPWVRSLLANQGKREVTAVKEDDRDIARLPGRRGRPKERGVCGTFVLDIELPIQGFDTPVLQEAKTLLEELAA